MGFQIVKRGKERHPEVQGLRKRATVVYDGDEGPRLG